MDPLVPRNGPGCLEAAGHRSPEQCPLPRRPPAEQLPWATRAASFQDGARLSPGQPPPSSLQRALNCPDPVYRAPEEVGVPGNAPAMQPRPQDKARRPRKGRAGHKDATGPQEGGPGHSSRRWSNDQDSGPMQGKDRAAPAPDGLPNKTWPLPVAFFYPPGAVRGRGSPRPGQPPHQQTRCSTL